MAGRPPTPISELKRRGTYRADRHAERPQFEAGLPSPPRKLNAAERKVWKYYCDLLGGRGTLTPGDAAGLLALVELEIDMTELRKKVAEVGHTYKTVSESGDVMIRKHPIVGMYETARRHHAAMLVQFGATPSSASRVKVAKQKAPASKWDQIDRVG